MPGVSASFAPLLIATATFILSHFVLSFGPVRNAVAARIGEQAFIVAYSAVALGTFAWMSIAYARAPFHDLWGDPLWARWMTVLTMPFVAVLITCGVTTANPGAVGFGGLLEKGRTAVGIQKVTRHPVMVAIAIWSALHLVTNGDAASLILFGGMLVLTLGGIAHIEARKRASGGEAWRKFAADSSVVPFAAIIAGRTRVTLREIGWNRIGAGVVVYFILLFGHRIVMDVPLLPGLFPR
ncbi:MAG: hypothetical protein RL477_2109 [Pseudomonadota bacterium]